MRRLFYYLGRIIPIVGLSLSALGGIGVLVKLFHSTSESSLTFDKMETAKALAVYAAKAAVTVDPDEDPHLRAARFQRLGWTDSQQDEKATVPASVRVLQALPLDPDIMSSTQVMIPVQLVEAVTVGAGTTQEVQIANVLLLKDGDHLVVAGPPWLLPDESTLTPPSGSSKPADTTTVRPMLDSFLQHWWSGADVKNDIATSCKLPPLAFQTSKVHLDHLEGTMTGEKMQVTANLTAIRPDTNTPVPMQLVFVLVQPVKDHWMIEDVYPF